MYWLIHDVYMATQIHKIMKDDSDRNLDVTITYYASTTK